MIRHHADVVGSLLRPDWLIQARSQLLCGSISQKAFEEIEDRAVDKAVSRQEEAGLEIVTDGEMRRSSFQSQLAGLDERLRQARRLKGAVG